MAKQMNQLIAVFVLIVLALALTPAVASFTTDATYQSVVEYHLIDADVSNSTSALAYAARNDSDTYEYFTIVIVAGGTGTVSEYGSAVIDCSQNITYTEATQIIDFDAGVFDKTKTYNMSITYLTDELTSDVVIALLPIVPILWIVAVLAVGVTTVNYLLKHR